MGVRTAIKDDVPAMVALITASRKRREPVQPVMWRVSEHAETITTMFFEALVDQDAAVTLVHETKGKIDGMLIGLEQQTPPVYDPGGKTYLVDDFTIAEDAADPAAAASALLAEAERTAKALGACQLIAVSPDCEPAKAAWLAKSGYGVTTHWVRKDL